jgi:hypothetical protein
VYVSANGRGAEFREPDYVVAMDEIHQTNRRPMGEHIRSLCKSVIISPHAYADVRLSQWPQQPRWVLSGMIATWASFLMGARVVYLAGFDAYGGDKGYLNEARKIALDVHCPVRVVSGPLTEVWPQYDPNERFTGRYQPHSSIDGWLNKDGIITVRARKACHVGHREVPAGEVLTVYRHEVRRLLKHRVLEEV